MDLELRTAVESDYKAIESLIAASIRKLGAADYSSEQIESALKTAFGLDTQLIADETYFVVLSERKMVACGGWSFRQTLFGSDSVKDRDPKRIDPRTGAAKIRAFFVHADFARMGIGTMIIDACEQQATTAGFSKLELMSTLPGVRFYQNHGFVAMDPINHTLEGQLTIEFVPMLKELSVGG